MRMIGRTRAALRAMDSNQRYFHDALIIAQTNDTYLIETFWKNPEIAGIWLYRYRVHRDCVSTMLHGGMIESAGKNELGQQSYRLKRPG